MAAYIARYTQTSTSNTVELTLDATNDAEAVREVRRLVSDGYRDEASCQVDLTDGRTYGASNRHGTAEGGYV